ncbi:diguanylate cyclase domain-containing protein [Secundilactobacillus similis]|uniref:GGDEF domain-containing protein n=1 Tax=Secundilactobacillus similis DSM 23365 = JCM 2765 TaxID=1423804 RepID=A0A0R2FAC2_9LACO|nr:diguanylate cyclase [Secundilactobacillus similis]KRN25295.1 GGDEF domain-containing protein [Secundilactobacillus similis DSM 23365 = JCM 2765]
MINNDQRDSIFQDVALLVFLLLFSAVAVLMTISGHSLVNVVSLFCTVVLLILTYFLGLIPSLLANMVFIAGQVIWTIYQYGNNHGVITWSLLFWLVMPILLSLSLYAMTQTQVALQQANGDLRAALVERGAFDQQTNLRTTVAYVEDASVFIETNERFKLPVSTVIIKIRYFDDMKRMMSENQLNVLLQLASETIKDITRDNDITYLVDNEDPTWAILLFSDEEGANIAADRIRAGFAKALAGETRLSSLAISMVVGIATWDPEEMNNPYDLMNAGIRETQYDVS